MDIKKIYHDTGKRKTSSSRVFLKEGSGIFIINKLDISVFLKNDIYMINFIKKPLIVTNMINKIDIKSTTKGGGVISQINSIRLALSKSLIKYNITFKNQLKKEKLLTSDSRIVERKKYGYKKSRKKKQFSKR